MLTAIKVHRVWQTHLTLETGEIGRQADAAVLVPLWRNRGARPRRGPRRV